MTDSEAMLPNGIQILPLGWPKKAKRPERQKKAKNDLALAGSGIEQEPAKAKNARLDSSGKPMTASKAVQSDGIWLLLLGPPKTAKIIFLWQILALNRNLPKQKLPDQISTENSFGGCAA